MLNTLLVAVLSMKSVPAVRVDRPRPAELKVTPVMFRVDLPVSLNTSLSWSPFNRLTPLNESPAGGVDLRQDVVVLGDQIGAGGLGWGRRSASEHAIDR